MVVVAIVCNFVFIWWIVSLQSRFSGSSFYIYTILIHLSDICACLYRASVSASPLIIPCGLNVGDTYRLMFVKSALRDATSSDIFVDLKVNIGVQEALNLPGRRCV